MTQIISMPRDHEEVQKHKNIFNAIGATSFITGQSHTMEDFIHHIKTAQTKPDFMIFDYSWAEIYEIFQISDLKEVPTIFMHANPNWVYNSTIRKFRKQFNFVGFLKTKDQNPDYRNINKENGDLPEPKMMAVLQALIDHKKQYPDVKIDHEIFEHLKAFCEIKTMSRRQALDLKRA